MLIKSHPFVLPTLALCFLHVAGGLTTPAPANTEQLNRLKLKQQPQTAHLDNNKPQAKPTALGHDEPTSYFRENSLANSFDQQVTFDQYVIYAMRAIHLVAGYDNDLHRYDNKQNLIDSVGLNYSFISTTGGQSLMRANPLTASELDLLRGQEDLVQKAQAYQQLKCGRYLSSLLAEARELFASSQSFSNSRNLKLIEFFDSFGAPEAQLIKGNSMWLGSHEQCADSRIKLDSGAPVFVAGRYCVANFRSPGWKSTDKSNNQMPVDQQLGSQSIKLGVCLPDACNSISYLRHADLIESLVKQVRFNQVPYSSYKLTHLYCLPDESSPLRQFSWSARIFIVSLVAWLSIVAYHTLKHELCCMNKLRGKPEVEPLDKGAQIFAFRVGWNNLFGSAAMMNQKVETARKHAIPKISVEEKGEPESDHESGFDSSDSESSCGGSASPTSQKQLSVGKVSESQERMAESLASAVVVVTPVASKTLQKAKVEAQVDLSSIDGIKVLSMIWLISGHTLLFFIRSIANGRDFWSVLRDARFLTIMAGIFPVDTFFTITGILTAYLKFNKSNGSEMKSVRYWMEAFVHRYLRFMPMYLFIFWYTRDVSEYIGSGPLWDYATADTSLRSMCKQESALVPLLFQANFKSIDQHCVKPAWYLANDYQFLLVTPLFIGLILKSRWIGYSVIGISVALSLVLQFLTVFFTKEMEDFEALINFKPMFGTYVLKNLWKLYVLPYNRVPPYLMGLITGHLMYVRQCRAQETVTEKPSTKSINLAQRVLPDSKSGYKALGEYVCLRMWTPLIFLISIIYLPLITKISTQEGLLAKIGTSCIMAFMRFVWSLSIARLIYICATRLLGTYKTNQQGTSDSSFIIRFLSSKKWKPWSKIGLSALLIQWEIISYLAQIQTSAPNITISFLLSMILICIVATYLLALLIYLTIEYPLSQIEHLYIRPALFGQQYTRCNKQTNMKPT